RSYLRTREQLPACDRLLQALCYGYTVFALIPALATISGLYYLDNYTLDSENIFIVLILAAAILTSTVAYHKKISAARHFLLANILPFLLAAGTAVYYLLHPAPAYTNMGSYLPEIAILSQLITFMVALLARLRIMNEALELKEQEMRKLAAEMALTEYRHMLLEQEHQLVTAAMREKRQER
ncbi:MAG TPA: 7TM diverse intracellular signaling domain-containing protein, partial [Chitinophaga sp.]